MPRLESNNYIIPALCLKSSCISNSKSMCIVASNLTIYHTGNSSLRRRQNKLTDVSAFVKMRVWRECKLDTCHLVYTDGRT